jgi:serpin B
MDRLSRSSSPAKLVNRQKQWTITCCGLSALLVSAVIGLATPAPIARFAVDANVKALSEAYNSSGHELFSRLATSPGNIVFSPYSVGTAMALALSGARGETEAEMSRVLKHQLTREQIDGANGNALAILNQHGKRAFFSLSRSADKLIAANAVVLTNLGNAISKDYLAAAKANYAAEVFENASLAGLNTWVSRRTEGKVETIIDELDPRTAAVLVNALYFKARWMSAFDSELTRLDTFEISPSDTVRAPIMHRKGDYPVVTDREFSAIRLPLQIPHLSMVIVLPKRAADVETVGARLDSSTLSGTFHQLSGAARKVDLALPRFKASLKVRLKRHFVALGMSDPFDITQANFSGMTGGRAALAISEIFHGAFIEVSESGAEAGAATAAPMITSGPQMFHVTRPFLFYIIDDATQAILFQGRITDPR